MEKFIHIKGGYPSKTEFLAALKAGVELYDISLSRCVWWDDILQRVAFCSMEPAAAVQAIADRRSWQDFESEMILPKDLSDFYISRYFNRTYFVNDLRRPTMEDLCDGYIERYDNEGRSPR